MADDRLNMPDRLLVRNWSPDTPLSEHPIEGVETRDNVIGRTLPLGEVGPVYLQYLRVTHPSDSDKEWARRQVQKRSQNK
jgi:hypothetical protein